MKTVRSLTVLATGLMGPVKELAPLEAAGHRIVDGRPLDTPARRPWTEPELVQAAHDAHVILASHLETISEAVTAGAPGLELVIVPFIGTDRIDIPAASGRGILVANSPTPENFVAVAEASIGLALVLLKRVKHNEAKLRRGEWAVRQDRGEFLFGKTVGIVGFGRIGGHLARRLAGWDVRLLAYDPYASRETARAHGVALTDLATLLAESDVVTLHAVLTPETQGLIGEKELDRMKPTAVLVNTARGGLVDEGALARALDEGHIAAAALDTFAEEPLPMASPLRAVDPARLILTPHNVSHSESGRRANLALALAQILALGRGEAPDHVVNPEAIARWKSRR